VSVLTLAANTVTNNPMGITLVATQPVANAINQAANPNRINSTARGGTRRKERRSKRRQQGGVRTMTVEILQHIFNEVMDTVRPIFTGLNFDEISLHIEKIIVKHVQG